MTVYIRPVNKFNSVLVAMATNVCGKGWQTSGKFGISSPLTEEIGKKQGSLRRTWEVWKETGKFGKKLGSLGRNREVRVETYHCLLLGTCFLSILYTT